MNTDEILQKLTTAQRIELHTGIALAAKKASAAYQKDPVTFAEINTSIRLTGEIYVNVKLSLYGGDKGVVHPVIENIQQFETIDEYLYALNKQPDSKDGFKK